MDFKARWGGRGGGGVKVLDVILQMTAPFGWLPDTLGLLAKCNVLFFGL